MDCATATSRIVCSSHDAPWKRTSRTSFARSKSPPAPSSSLRPVDEDSPDPRARASLGPQIEFEPALDGLVADLASFARSFAGAYTHSRIQEMKPSSAAYFMRKEVRAQRPGRHHYLTIPNGARASCYMHLKERWPGVRPRRRRPGEEQIIQVAVLNAEPGSPLSWRGRSEAPSTGDRLGSPPLDFAGRKRGRLKETPHRQRERRPMAESGFDQAVKQNHLALAEFVKGDPEPLKTMYSHRDDVSLANPFGPPARGWEQAAATMERAATP